MMITGDNELTSINIAKKCGIIDIDNDVYFGSVASKTNQIDDLNDINWQLT
jgi:magnesium-transporting ATPase (P-type)